MDEVSSSSRADTTLAVKNAVKLFGSLMVTWGIALGVRLMLPRYLGPQAFGVVNFADAFASTLFVLAGFGVETYIRKEVSVRSQHASEFFGGVTALRVLVSVLLFGVTQAFLVIADRPPETWAVVHLFGVSALLVTFNQSLAALLHARGTVNELSVLNIVSKIVWGGLTVVAVLVGWPLWTVALAVVISEALKTAVSVGLVTKHLAMRWTIDRAATRLAVVGSLPIFVNLAAHTIYSKLDVSILTVVASEEEVGWYGAASLLSGLAMMVTPMIGWVLMPLFARARARSDEEYTRVMRRSLELVLAIAFPTSLFMALGAKEWITLLYGPAFAPAATSLKVLASIFVLTYVAILSANALILTGRAWTQALISIGGLVANPVLNWLFIAPSIRWFGKGGAGMGAAIAQLGTEIVVTVAMTALVGRRAFDARSLGVIGRLLVACVAVSALDFWLIERTHPYLRLGVDAVVYAALVLGSGAVNVKELITFVRSARQKAPPLEAPEAAPVVP
jgi:O-antigen/teichoic acid export membrane protein